MENEKKNGLDEEQLTRIVGGAGAPITEEEAEKVGRMSQEIDRKYEQWVKPDPRSSGKNA